MKRREVRAKSLMLTLASLPTMAIEAPAQTVRGDFSGFVRDATGALVPGVNVVIVNETTNARRVVETDDQGRYAARASSSIRIASKPPSRASRKRSTTTSRAATS